MNPYIILASVAVFAALTGGAYYQGRKDGEANVIAQEAREEKIAKISYENASRASADAISKIEVKNVYQKQILEREVRENVVYRECKHSSAGLRGVNSALSGNAAEPTGDSELPKTNTSNR